MINPNGEPLSQKDPLAGSINKPAGEAALPGDRLTSTAERVSTVASDAWRQTREKATVARERTEFFLRENPVPTILGALALGVAIGLAIRYSSESEPEVQVKSPLGNVNLGVLSLPFLWPFFKTVKHRYADTADLVRERVSEGVDRLKSVDVDEYVKPLRKKWRSYTR